MAIRFAVKSGNFSDPTVWDNGAVPLTGDNIFPNGYTVTLDTNATVLSISNFASGVYVPDIATPAMTSNSTPSGIVTASSVDSTNFPYSAFNQDGYQGVAASQWRATSANTGWLQYQFPSAKTIRRYAIFTGGNVVNAPRTWTFEGSNDGTNWTVLDTQTNLTLAANSWYGYSIASPASYLYYRINITATNTAGNGPSISELNMTESTGAVSGVNYNGTFNLANGVTFTCTSSVGLYSNGSTAPLTFSLASPNSATLNCNVAGINNTANNTTITHSGTGTLTINGNLVNQGAANAIYLINFTAAGTLNIVGDLTANAGNSTNVVNVIKASGGGTINITGNVFQSAVASALNTFVIANGSSAGSANVNITGNISTTNTGTGSAVALSSGNVVVNGNLVAGGSNCIATSAGNITVNGNVTTTGNGNPISTSTTGNITVSGIVTASTTANAINSSSTGLVICNGSIVNNSNGIMAVFAQRMNISASTSQTWNMFRAGAVARNLLTPDQIIVSGTFPAVSDVRSGVTYGMGTYTGTCAMPSYLNVTLGVPVDAGTGAAYTPANIADLIWNKLTSTLTVSGSAGERVKNISTVDTTGAQIAALRR